MILKVSHLVFSSTDFEENSLELTSLGYNCIFTEKSIKNSEVKRSLFQHFYQWHDVRYFTFPSSVSVELLNWRSQSDRQSNFVPVFENIKQNNSLISQQRKFNCDDLFSFSECALRTLELPIFTIQQKDAPSKLNALLVKTNHLEKSISFWQLFRFVVREKKDNFALLELTSFLPQSPVFQLYLEQTKRINENPCLDDRGVSCISFLSSSAPREKDLLKSKGFPIIDVGGLLINGKMLTVFFTLGPCGELVEVIDVKEVDSN